MIAGEIGAGSRYESGKASDKVCWTEQDVRGAVVERVLELVHALAGGIDREAVKTQCRPSNITAQPLEPGELVCCAPLTGDGMIYLSEHTMILDYTANIEGQIEHNTNVWDAGSTPIRRSGVIRQPDCLIWFATKMSRVET